MKSRLYGPRLHQSFPVTFGARLVMRITSMNHSAARKRQTKLANAHHFTA
jgi:hypothetical protein